MTKTSSNGRGTSAIDFPQGLKPKVYGASFGTAEQGAEKNTGRRRKGRFLGAEAPRNDKKKPLGRWPEGQLYLNRGLQRRPEGQLYLYRGLQRRPKGQLYLNRGLQRRPKGPLYAMFLSAFVVAALSLAVLAGCSSEPKQAAQAPAEKVRDVTVVQIEKVNVPDYVEATGTVRATLTAQLASQVMGTITGMNVHEGSAVRQGQVLVTLDAAQPQASYQRASAALAGSEQSIAAADADYALAEATMKRYQMLYDKKSVSPQEYDEVKTKLAAAKARRDAAHAGRAEADAAVAEAKTVVGFSRIRAPFNGVVTAKLADVGAMAAPGVPLLIVEDQGQFRLEATVDESKMGAVRLGESVPVVIDALGDREFTGKVVQIVPVADPASRSFVVKVELPAEEQIRSGLFGRAKFARGQKNTILIPQTAVLNRGQLQAVYVVGKDQLASLRYVTLGAPSGQQVEVLSGLQDGDQIVAQAGDRELSGKQIEAK